MTIEVLGYDNLPTEVGKQIHVNHDGCPSGTDTKKRLYIKRATANSYIYYCHHCQDSGVKYIAYNDHQYARINGYDLSTADNDIPFISAQLLKKDLSPITSFEIVSYLKGYGISDDDLVHYQMKQFRDVALYLPNTIDSDDEYATGQLRYFGAKNYARYKTLKNTPPTNLFTDDKCDDRLFIVEDSISAYRVFRDSSYTSAALSIQGTGISDAKIEAIRSVEDGYKRIIVWLDDDGAGKKASLELLKKLKPLLKVANVSNVTGMFKEPKLIDRKNIIVVL